ncbi:rhodanese-like domain-containing protein [Saccharibacter sp. 17.LH.SD]|uniref:rhodanese-like domain-containing protein n=1 Tax=Saccharibacter sp. 17.LH.SD TaxID=2689393 RepID=UPI001F3ED539|nr:rhodanese-like domain-containing protein [Saccharibacter sp. 17.LH.SD]
MMKNILAKEAWHFLEQHPDAVLIDVRTPQEWAAVGFPDVSTLGREAVALTWKPEEVEGFQKELEEQVSDKKAPLLFLCRSGVRSHHASTIALGAGYGNVTNIIDGFEDRHGPGTGWRASGLPFVIRSLA